MSLRLVNEMIIIAWRTIEIESSEAFFVGKLHWRVVNFRCNLNLRDFTLLVVQAIAT